MVQNPEQNNIEIELREMPSQHKLIAIQLQMQNDIEEGHHYHDKLNP